MVGGNQGEEDPCLLSTVFFFSSRRRHTRYIGDWSSDVCSSDLCFAAGRPFERKVGQREAVRIFTGGVIPDGARSEERRVGKECRFRGAPVYLKKTGKVKWHESEDGIRSVRYTATDARLLQLSAV